MPRAKRPLPGKRYPLNMRTTRELREQIERAAKASGRSLVQEVEYRLEQSFAGDPLVRALTGGGETALRLIALAMQYETAAEDGRPWKDDSGKAEAVRTAAHLIIAAIAGLSATPPATTHDDAQTALRPAERGRLLAMQLLERSGLKLPAE